MHYHALAMDYDGTIATKGRVDDLTMAALSRLRESGRKLLLVTGRELDDLFTTFDRPEIFDRIVAENGALIYDPSSKDKRLIGSAPPEVFIDELKLRGVNPISVGHVIVATWEPHQAVVLEVIRDQGLELQVIFNKGAVMILPSGVNKATGLALALAEMGLSRHNVVGVGDAENDHAFLDMCGCSAAVSNAIPSVKERTDLVTKGDHGAGVTELIERMIADDLQGLTEDRIRLGETDLGETITVNPVAEGILVCGSSGSGKSTLTTGLLERLAAEGYQIAIFDPEGDYDNLDFAISLGSPQRAPLVEEVLDILKDPFRNLSVNLLGVALEHRPSFFAELLPRVLELRSRTGRPHVLVVDEAHHLLPKEWRPAKQVFPERTRGILYITIHPESLADSVLETIDRVIAVGDEPANSIGGFCEAAGLARPTISHLVNKLPTGDAMLYRRGEPDTVLVHTEKPTTERKRHSRKYAEGNLGPARSFYFRGREGKLNLKAHNLMVFLQLADGVDDETWLYHLNRREYSAWMQRAIKDSNLALDVEAIERDRTLTPLESRQRIRSAVESRYTLPADQPSGKVDS
jgi:hydroxymethylpyrimidine pyrophosphatase-like HAD family hydrolase